MRLRNKTTEHIDTDDQIKIINELEKRNTDDNKIFRNILLIMGCALALVKFGVAIDQLLFPYKDMITSDLFAVYYDAKVSNWIIVTSELLSSAGFFLTGYFVGFATPYVHIQIAFGLLGLQFFLIGVTGVLLMWIWGALWLIGINILLTGSCLYVDNLMRKTEYQVKQLNNYVYKYREC